jgi:hypothetical protein
MADRIAELDLPVAIPAAGNASSFPERPPRPSSSKLPHALIADAAERFVSMYLAHSRPEPLWRPFLERLQQDDGLAVLVATDHYAEATPAIVCYLRDWGIPAERLKNDAAPTQPPPFLVANSADLGFWKAERPFWETVRKRLPYNFHHIVIIDDFGFNEADVAGYGMLSRVRERRIDTKTVLEDVFQTGVSALPFLTQRGDTFRRDALHERILKTMRKIEEVLALHRVAS